MPLFVLTRRLRANDLQALTDHPDPRVLVMGQALLSDFSDMDEHVKLLALSEEVKETGLVPQFAGPVELKTGPELITLLLNERLVHL